jgi:hypothetical protein
MAITQQLIQLNGGQYGGYIYNTKTQTATLDELSVKVTIKNNLYEITDLQGAWIYSFVLNKDTTTAEFVNFTPNLK